MKPLLAAEKVSYSAGSKAILEEVSLQVREGEFVSLIGPSGSGKSTLLGLLAGFLKPKSGRVNFRGEELRGPSRKRAVIFQNHALFPWLSAVENVRFATVDGTLEKAQHYLELVGLGHAAALLPKQLSGGMQQRVGIARALAAEPEVLLLDEPFASLDMIHREILSQELLRLARNLQKALVFVTHNIDEALYLGDRVYILAGGPARVVGEQIVKMRKPERLLDCRSVIEFQTLERSLHEHLYDASF